MGKAKVETGKPKVEKKTSKAMSPYASKAEKVSHTTPMEPSTPSTQGTNMTDEELEADLTQVGKKLSVHRNIYLTQDGDDNVSMDLDSIPKKKSPKRNAKVCYTPPAKAKGK